MPLILATDIFIKLFDLGINLPMTPLHMQITKPIFNKTITIHKPISKVWDALTVPALMKRWMSETELNITTDWEIGSPIIISGALYKKPFENKGTVLTFEPEQVLEYTHLSSLSRLPYVIENYCILNFNLKEIQGGIILTLFIRNFPTDTIYKHLAFYWNVALELLKKFVEDN